MLHSLCLFISIHSYFFVYSSFSQIYTGNNNYGCRIKLEIIHSTTRFCYLYIFLIADPSPTIIYRFASKFLTHALIFKIIGSRAILFWMQSYKSRISILNLLQELSCYLFKKINKTSTNSVQKIVKIVYDLHRIAIGILLRISISWKKKKRKEKGGGKILRKNISNFNQFPIPRTAQLNHSFTTIQKLSKSSPNQYQDTCVVSHSRIEASSRSNFLETKIYNFPHTHTHTYAHSHERVHTPPKSCPVVEVSCCTLRPFHSPPSFYFAPWLRFTPSNAPSFLFLIASQSRTNDFYRVSSIVCLDTGSFDRFLRHLSTCTDVTQNIYETWTKFLLWNYLVSFSFVRRDCCYFFPSDGKWSIAWKVVGNISRGDKLKNCFGFEFFRQESSTDFLKFGFHPNENSREENNLFRRISF